jgi:hypothetical protein
VPTSATNAYTAQPFNPIYSPETAKAQHIAFGASLTLTKGTVIGIKTADSKAYAYNNGNADGTEVAKGILIYDVTTDGSGNVTLGGGGLLAPTFKTAPYWYTGTFKTSEMTGLDAAGVADLGRLISGTAADGILQMM